MNFLRLLMPEGATIAKGTMVGNELQRFGMVTTGKGGRWAITPAGRLEVERSRRS